MKQLELQQQAEEQALLAATGGSPSPSSNGGSKPTGPVRSRSGNDLAGFGAAAAAASAISAKSMPGSRRHSGELKDGEKDEKNGSGVAPGATGGNAGGRRVQVADKEGKPMLNSFLFDDELDADLQSESQPRSY